MDRREALKKLAAGGAVAAGTTAVLSSTAFANPGTQNCAATGSIAILGTRAGNQGDITLTAVLTGATCPCPGGGTPTVVGALTWTLNSVAPTSQPSSLEAFFDNMGTFSGSYTVAFRVRCLDRNGQSVCALYSGSGSASHAHPSLVVGPITGVFTYDSNVCP